MNHVNFFDVVSNELSHAQDNFPKFNTPHEGYAILKEEVDELWDAIKLNEKRNPDRSKKIRREAVQVAAMALRFLYDCCEPKTGETDEQETERMEREMEAEEKNEST